MLPSSLRPATTAALVIAGHSLLAVVLTWPLVLHLTSALPGDPTGDTGIYVWNLWIFRHEILRHGHLPFSTDHMFAFTGGADFSLHNYTPLAGLAGLVLIPLVGVAGAFNVVMLAFLTASGGAVYLLARQLELRSIPAWMAGALFIASPVITARETAHLSLVSAAPLPLFLWALLRTLDRPSTRKAVFVGAVVAAATYSDAYFGVYCVLMGLFVLAWRLLTVERTSSPASPLLMRVVDGICMLVSLVIAWRIYSGVTLVSIGPIRVGLAQYYTPVLLLVVFVGLRAWLTWSIALRLRRPHIPVGPLVVPGIFSVATCLALLSPLLVGLALRVLDGRLPATSTYWRSSPRGVDLLAYLVPNPNHAWIGKVTQRWLLPPRADAFPEFVASFSLVALAVVLLAARRKVLPRLWIAFTGVFILLSLGPFVHVAGSPTYVTGPWAFLRYAPVIGMARSPARMAIVAALGFSILFAFAIQDWLMNGSRRHIAATAVAGLLIALELVPAPRKLYSARVPDIYRLVAASMQDEDGRLLELPTGVRDGTSSLGDFNASSAYFQTAHKRPLIGGYLSRVAEWRRREYRRQPVLQGISRLSEGEGTLPEELVTKARASRERFLARSCLRFVIVDKLRASKALRSYATSVLDLRSVHEDERYELLTPASSPACDARPFRRWSVGHSSADD